MIPILFEKDETLFQSNGLGRLADCLYCHVVEERNGIYECTFKMPIESKMYKKLTEGRYVYITHDNTRIPQPFEIIRRTAPIDGVVTFLAQHISYKLNKQTLNPYSASSCANAIARIAENVIGGTEFTFWTDKDVTSPFNLTVPKTVRNVLGGEEGSLLDVYGKGEYEWDMFNVKLYLNRGRKTGITLRYGKNISSFEQTRDMTGTYNAVVPYWIDSEGNNLVLLDDRYVYAGDVPDTDASDFVLKAIPLDLSSDFEEQPTEEQLRSRATAAVQGTTPWRINDTLKVDFVQLWETDEYKDYAALQRVGLCDTVNVVLTRYGIEAEDVKVIKVDYDSLNDKYALMELGETRPTLGQVIAERVTNTVMNNVPTKSQLGEAVDHATQMITGSRGGHIHIVTDAEGKPQELLILDKETVGQSDNIWRWNLGGLGFSSTGYNGTYGLALTSDGRINADMITTGQLDANLIRSGTIKSSNPENKSYWDVGSGTVYIEQYDPTINNVNAYMAFQNGYLTIGKEDSNIKSYFTNDELYFADNGGVKHAWISTTGFGTNELDVGSPTISGNRWRIFASEDGSRLTFTRRLS